MANRPSGKILDILEELLGWRSMDTMGMIHEFEITNPSSQISHLKIRWKVPIDTEIIHSVDKQGKPTRYARYRIPPSELQMQRERFGFND